MERVVFVRGGWYAGGGLVKDVDDVTLPLLALA